MKTMGQELPSVNQIEQHVGWHDDEMIEWCAANKVVVQAATPLARSLPALVQVGGDPTVSAIAKKYSKSPAQVALRFLIEKGVAMIPSAASAAYQTENLDIFDFELTSDEVASLGRVAAPCRGNPADGLAKCWADPGDMMCGSADGRMFHCP